MGQNAVPTNVQIIVLLGYSVVMYNYAIQFFHKCLLLLRKLQFGHFSVRVIEITGHKGRISLTLWIKVFYKHPSGVYNKQVYNS